MKRATIFFTILLVAISFTFYGCSSSPNADNPSKSSEDDGHTDHGDHSKADKEKMKAELAKLSPDDRASAEKQHICPVSQKTLGTMGAPEKVDVKGRQVWICCTGCKDTLLENPDEYLAKLKQE